jgi:hypothetical protein
VRLASLPLLLVLSGLSAAVVSCGSDSGDPPSDLGVPPIGGKDKRIKDVGDPSLPGHADDLTSPQAVSGAVVVAVDKYDETANGKGLGTIYVQDLGSTDPYSGISLFAPSFNPGNLSVAPGDVLDLRGTYQENSSIGATVTFAKGAVLPQLSKPVATFRYETDVPQPLDIDVADLADFTKARRWLGMLVRIKNITLLGDGTSDTAGRVSIDLNTVTGQGTSCNAAFPKAASLVNDLFDMAALKLVTGQKLTSIVGVVGFFCNVHLAPRSKADIQPLP